MIKKIAFSLTLILFLTTTVYAFEYEICNLGWKHVHHKHNEASYQHAWCVAHKGIEEYENKDYTRVDCLTSVHAVEFDFANKWQEAIGQAEHYALMTGKKGMVVLILEDPKAEMVYFNRVKRLGQIHNFDVSYITPEILNIKDGKCQYANCKCHSKNKFKFLRYFM